MYLKSIEIQGFKSFANKITFEFHNGITGIVGPNGSGKSNVGDAVRWVLGEQSAKQLRGGNMQDVIFSGTETRKPLGFASVAITLDNSDHKLDVDFEEVTVTRRLYRSGESEYLMNGASCRLKDINELFYDTGIGKEGYSIIGQGQIDKILNGKPEDRRELFDEAAGIVKFKRRKNTALKKLEQEQQNLVRVTDILTEITRQLGPLEKQAETARIYLKKREALKNLEVNMFLLELDRITEQIWQVEEKYKAADAELMETRSAFEKTKVEYEELESQLYDLDGEITVSREKENQSLMQKQQLEGQIQVLQEQILAAKQSDEHFQSRKEVLDLEIEKRMKELQELEKEYGDLKQQAGKVLDSQEESQARLQKVQQEIAGCTEAVETGKREIIDILNARVSTKGKLQRYDAMLEQIGIRRAELNQRVLRLKSDESRQNRITEELKEQYGKISEEVQALQAQENELEQEIARLQSELTGQSQRLEVEQGAYHRDASRLESLQNITERYDGYGNSIRKIMEQKSRNSGIHGVVADLIQTRKEYETAIETALGGSIQNIVTDNENTAKYLIEFLKRNRFGRATFLPLTSMNRKQNFSYEKALTETGVIGLASKLVECEPLYEALAAQLLGKTVVVDTIDHAITLARKYKYGFRMVTLEGELLSPGGSMTGGSFKNNSNLLGRRREIEELEKGVRGRKRELEQLQHTIEENRRQRNLLRENRTELNEQLQKLYLKQNTAKVTLEQEMLKIQSIQSGYAGLKKEGSEIDFQVIEIQENKKAINIQLEESAQREKELEAMILEQERVLEEKQVMESDENSRLNEIMLEAAALKQKEDFSRQNMRRLDDEKRQLEAEKLEIAEALQEGGKKVHSKEAEIIRIKEEIEKAQDTARNEGEKVTLLSGKKEELNGRHKSFFQKRDELSEHVNRMDKECFRLGNQKEKLEESRDGQISYIWDAYELTPSQAQTLKMDEMPERNAIKKEVAELKESIRNLGNVNVNAIEDYKELLERHTFLYAQHSDLVKAEETLKGIIEELDTGMRRQFTEKFAEIRTEFDKVFKQLFGGGKGTLELMEDEDVLEAGIRIISQPPGKKLQNMMQLSGGEKALTAIALLFAIQNLKPSPFCLLDEIEAALDDSNVTRFARYLHKLTKNTQFIIITHRRGTMVAADRLYGITMQEKGISTLVSVNLIEKELDK